MSQIDELRSKTWLSGDDTAQERALNNRKVRDRTDTAAYSAVDWPRQWDPDGSQYGGRGDVDGGKVLSCRCHGRVMSSQVEEETEGESKTKPR